MNTQKGTKVTFCGQESPAGDTHLYMQIKIQLAKQAKAAKGKRNYCAT
jgi:hypothetical protein